MDISEKIAARRRQLAEEESARTGEAAEEEAARAQREASKARLSAEDAARRTAEERIRKAAERREFIQKRRDGLIGADGKPLPALTQSRWNVGEKTLVGVLVALIALAGFMRVWPAVVLLAAITLPLVSCIILRHVHLNCAIRWAAERDKPSSLARTREKWGAADWPIIILMVMLTLFLFAVDLVPGLVMLALTVGLFYYIEDKYRKVRGVQRRAPSFDASSAESSGQSGVVDQAQNFAP